MPIHRMFLDWARPGTVATAEWLLARFRSGRRADLRGVVVATPGARVGRRILELLVDQAAAQRLDLVPPRLVTAGALPELLYQAKKPFADDLTQHLAWVAALKSFKRQELAPLLRHPPESDDATAWLPLGEMVAALHRELAADGLDCPHVVDSGRDMPGFHDGERWSLLAEIQRRYLRQLDAVELWDRQTARLYAIEHHECRTDCQIVVAGAVDMNRTQRAMIDQVADQVTALVFAPEEIADRFDEHGCVIPDQWQHAEIPVDPATVTVADGPGDQADAVVRALAGFDGRYAADEIVVGVPDERLTPYVQQRLDECDLPSRYGPGRPVSQSEPYRLVESLTTWLETGRYEAFANLFRHPAIERWLLRTDLGGDALGALDAVQSQRLPWDVRAGELKQVLEATERDEATCEDEPRRQALRQKARVYRSVTQLVARLDELLEPLASGKKRLGEWGDAIGRLLTTIYGDEPVNTEDLAMRDLVEACRAVGAALVSQRGVPERLAPRVGGAEALRLTLQEAGGTLISPPARDAAIELLGWLELPMDDAPALVVAGLNEGIVPSSRNADLFLPNELRRRLGLEDNDRRYARDAYALCVLVASRPALRLIAGRRTAENDPLLPSRLLFACPPDEIARRTRAWIGEPPVSGRLVLPSGVRHGGRSKFEPPRPRPLAEPVESMSVTEFRDYLACPYRYYLRHRLRLAQKSDASQELDAGQFGNLLHEVVKSFGEECVRDAAFAGSTDSDEIAAFLNDRLDGLARAFYGAEPLPAVRVQVEFIRRRLMRFAQWQADWARQGWRVRYVEQDIPADEAALPLASGPMKIRGRIDRIDARGDETVVFDYKTGDSGKSPQDTHWNKKDERWIDLQLPLYRHACRFLAPGRPAQVGYILLPKAEDKVGAKLADWDDAQFDSALCEAERIATLVRDEEFWPPSAEPPGTFDELATICGDYRFAAPPADDTTNAGP